MTCSILSIGGYLLLAISIIIFYKTVLSDYTKESIKELAEEQRLNGGFKRD